MFPSRIFFSNLFDDFDLSKHYDKHMRCDVYEENGYNIFEIDLPGFKKDDIKVDLDNGYLTVSAEKKDQVVEENKNYIHRERCYHSKCERSFYVGEVDENDIKASFDNGILRIRVSKEAEKHTTKKSISID